MMSINYKKKSQIAEDVYRSYKNSNHYIYQALWLLSALKKVPS